jgi:hypothetical protein
LHHRRRGLRIVRGDDSFWVRYNKNEIRENKKQYSLQSLVEWRRQTTFKTEKANHSAAGKAVDLHCKSE